ncbi:RTX toxin [Bdellovibrio bacteriovorus]|uniref:CUB domain-containing protein n=1 Tax=Bdellovibrio bacteriovorus TaxID=959 RepID=UPI0021D10DC8|nr:CUB domain-containing protein [Bdellovibrio bacteriovorus]UXR63830.1 RTX toxin [Bdellovibrio bacteriovorus]
MELQLAGEHAIPTTLKWNGDSLTQQGVLKAEWNRPSKADIKEQQILYFRGDSCETPILPVAHVGPSESSHLPTFTPEDGVEYTFKVFILLSNGSMSSSSCSNPITYLGAFSVESLSQSLINENNVASAPFQGTCLLGSVIEFSAGAVTNLKTFTCTDRQWSETLDLSPLPTLFSGDLIALVTAPSGTPKEYRLAITKDVMPPTITLDSLPVITSLNQTAYIISGTCSEASRAVSLVTGGTLQDTVPCTGGTYTKTLDLTALSGASVTVTATHTDPVGNTRTASATVSRDVTGPVVSSLALNNGAAVTNSLSATVNSAVSDVTEMLLTSNATCTGGSWVAYNTSASWTLTSANATNTVYAKFRDANGNETACLNDDILHDNIAPTLAFTAPTAGALVHSGNVTAFTVSGTCSEDTRSITLSGPASFTGTTLCNGSSFSAILDLSVLPQGTFQLTATLNDAAGNSQAANSPTYLKDTDGPTGALSINAGAATTNDLDVTLGLTGTDADEMYISNTAGCSTGGTWESFAASKTWTLPTADTLNTVYVKYRDSAGNTSPCYSDDITHISTIPSLSLASPVDGSYVNLANVSAFVLSGACSEEGRPVSISVTGQSATSATCASGAWTKTLDLSASPQGNLTFTLNHTRANGAAASEVNKVFAKDTVVPTVDSFVINNNDVYTNSLSATLSSSTTDGVQMYATNTALCLSGGAWETFATSKSWTLPTANNTNTIYFKVRDVAGNESDCAFDSIIHDSVTPTVSLTSPVAGTFINSINQVAFALSGACSENGQAVNLSVTDQPGVTGSATCTGNTWSTTLDVSSLANTSGTPYTVVASHSRVSGNNITASSTYPKDAQAPAAATLSGAPTGTNLVNNLNVTVGGTDISHYRYFIVPPGGSEVCTNSAAYTGSDLAVATKITDALSAQGSYKLCVFGRDAAGNWATSATEATWVRDTQGPVILNVDAITADGIYGPGQTIQVRVNFDENVTVVGTPRLTLETGSADREAMYASGSGTTSLVFTYQVQANDQNPDLDYTSTSALALSGATLRDALNNNATLTLPAPGSANSLAGTKDINIDAYSSPLAKAILGNVPMGADSNDSLNIAVTGLDVVAYKYKVGLYDTTDCSSAADYSGEIAAATPITNDISAHPRYSIFKICVLGKDSSGNWQKTFTATQAQWHYSENIPTYNLCDTVKSSTAPKGRLYDSGGPTADYNNNETIANCYFSITTGAAISALISYDTENNTNYDFLRLRETGAAGAILLGPVAGTVYNTPVASTSGTLYAEFKSDTSVVKSGIILSWGGIPNLSPTLAFASTLNTTPNTVYTKTATALGLSTATVFSVSGYDAEIRNITAGTGFGSSVLVAPGDSVEVRMTSPNANDQYRLAHIRAGDVSYYWTVATPLTPTAVSHVTSSNANGTYKPGDVIDIQVVFTKPVTVVSPTPSLSLNSGSGILATYLSGSGSTELTFRYTVTYENTAADLDYSTTSVTNGTSIKDVLNNNATTTLPAVGSANSLAGRKDIIIEGYPAVIAYATNVPASNSAATSLDVTVGGTNVVAYKYKLGTAATTDCLAATSYSAETDISANITADLTTLPDDERLKLCLLGKHTNGTWQPLWHPSEYQWDRYNVQNHNTLCVNSATTATAGFLYDSGGPSGMYNNNETCQFEINTGAPITLSFLTFNTEAAWDKVTVYDGTTAGTVLLNNVSGTAIPASQTANSGKMTFRFTSDGSAIRDGWIAYWGNVGPLMSSAPIFTKVHNATLNTRYTTANVTLGTISQASIATITGHDALIRNVTTGSYWGTSVPVSSGNVIQLRMTSPSANAQTHTASVTIGNVVGTWEISTPYPAPTPTLNGYPVGVSLTTTLNVTVSGFRVSQYKKAIITSGTCATASYSGAVAASTVITDNISALPNGPVTLCVLGGDQVNLFQSPADAVSVTWSKDSISTLNITSTLMNRVQEGVGDQTITVSLSPAKFYDVTAYYKITGDAVNPDHHNLTSGFITIPANTTTANITVNFPDNNLTDGEKLMNLHFTHTDAPAAVLGINYQTQYFIADDEMNLKASALSISRGHQCAIMEDTSLRCWGGNMSRQVTGANTDFQDIAVPVTIAGVAGFRSVATGEAHTCAVSLDNRLFCWGNTDDGQVGGGSSSGTQSSPLHIDTGTTYLSVVSGDLHTCALTTDNKIKCWGRNDYGQLGLGDTTERTSPTDTDNASSYKYLTAGSRSTCAIRMDDKLFCWGYNANYQLGDGSATAKNLPAAIDATESYKMVAVGSKHGCAITLTDNMKCWGTNNYGQVGDNSLTTRSQPVAVYGGGLYKFISVNDDSTNSTARGFTCAITTADVLQCWGANMMMQVADPSLSARNQPTVVDAGTTYSDVRTSAARACGITQTGALKCWGNLNGDIAPYNGYAYGSGNFYHMFSPKMVPVLDTTFTKLSVFGADAIGDSSSGTCGLSSNKLFCWGSMSTAYGPFGDGTEATSVRRSAPVMIDPTTNYSYLSPKRHFDVCAVTSTGQMKCWGTNTVGELGEAAAVGQTVSSPKLADSTASYSKVISYENATCGITTTGVLKCSGYNAFGRLGLGDTTNRTTFTVVDDGVSYSDIDIGAGHMCGITTTGVLKCWGSNSAGQIAKNSGTSSYYLPDVVDSGVAYVKIAVGPYHSCGITAANKLKCWGQNFNGLLGDGTTMNRYTPTPTDATADYSDISAAPTHTCGVSAGQIKCWGNSTASGLGTPHFVGSNSVNHLPTVVDSGTTTYTAVYAANYATCGKTSGGEVRCVGRAHGNNFGFVDAGSFKTFPGTANGIYHPTFIHKWQGY